MQDPNNYIVDGTNVCWWYSQVHRDRMSAAVLFTLLVEILEHGDQFTCIFDAPISHLLREQGEPKQAEIIELLIKKYPLHFYLVTGSTRADSVILHNADYFQRSIITNDVYRNYRNRYTWLNDRYTRRLIQGNFQPSGLITIEKIPYGQIVLRADFDALVQRLGELLDKQYEKIKSGEGDLAITNQIRGIEPPTAKAKNKTTRTDTSPQGRTGLATSVANQCKYFYKKRPIFKVVTAIALVLAIVLGGILLFRIRANYATTQSRRYVWDKTTWGMSPSEIMRLYPSVTTNKGMMLQSAKISGIDFRVEFSFTNESLNRIVLKTKFGNYALLSEILSKKYGHPRVDKIFKYYGSYNQSGYRYRWYTANTKVTYEYYLPIPADIASQILLNRDFEIDNFSDLETDGTITYTIAKPPFSIGKDINKL